MKNKWREMYKEKLMTAEEAVKLIPDNSFVATPLTNGQPPEIINAMAQRMAAGDLKGVEYLCSLAVRFLELHKPEVIDKICQYNTLDVMYNGPIERYLLNQGLYHYVPHRLFDGPKMVEVANMQAALITVSPMDEHGFFIVTEYGVAYLKGYNLRDRAKALINIAHPDFRDWLLAETRKMNY